MRWRCALLGITLLSIAALACAREASGTEPGDSRPGEARKPVRFDVLVFAPHPDDEILGCAGVILQALAQGKRVGIVVLTNGDGYPKAAAIVTGKTRDRLTHEDFHKLAAERQQQTLDAVKILGVPKRNVMFLGYPDSLLAKMYRADDTKTFRQEFTERDSTYGAVAPDYHSKLHGRPAPYRRLSLLEDIADILQARQPSEVYVTHQLDRHSDHQAAMWFVRDAARAAGYGGEFFTYIVHGEQQPELSVRRVPLTAEQVQKKRAAIRPHQIPVVHDSLGSYARDEEVFWRLPLDASKSEKSP